ncbi:hypothetical protein K4L44_11930 [Halosquirtibacter laminarini]|uniref:Uncharacterized protein n=1 Tax=Halosquirtibacter laminarini TaxID=3374600 RepID=A0AC61NMX3_9BACT|nr:hypothetical protein K4L44_11930 [Prolixibacteraceae bacterium]
MSPFFVKKKGLVLVLAVATEEETHDVGEVFCEFVEGWRWDVEFVAKETCEEDDEDYYFMDVPI